MDTDLLSKILFATIGTMGFAVGSNIRGWKLLFTSLGGAIGWGSYLLVLQQTHALLLSIFIGALLVSLYSEILGRIFRVPITVFVVCGIIPLVPGSVIYYAMSQYVQGNFMKAMRLMMQALLIAGTISISIAVVSTFANIFQDLKRRL
ncbi:MAG TPA: threonine/serine exporter family protein [Candidatus Cloacimonadota bacterium]|nr:threonine/serine exporter family protein [Candidatus Cloacimonadota bacterium]HPT70720.1 threonine/serine exporter family protein [Candidatus Cloacimonadota bacterium]